MAGVQGCCSGVLARDGVVIEELREIG